MEIRCGKCNKLFRVSNDKITGSGVKFPCTRCGDVVKITREAFDDYTLAQSAVSALDLFDSKAAPPGEPVPAQEPAAAGTAAVSASVAEETGVAKATVPEQQTRELPTSQVPDFLQERDEQPSPEHNTFEESSLMMEQPSPEEPAVPSAPVPAEMPEEPVKGPEVAIEPGMQQEPAVAAEPEQKPQPEPEPRAQKGPEYAQKSGTAPEPVSEQKPAVTTETTAVPRMGAGPAIHARPAAPAISAAPGVSPAGSAKGPVRQAGTMPPKAATATTPPEPARSSRLLVVMLAVFLIAGLAGLGTYLYVRSSPPAVKAPGTAMVSIEGLLIVNPVGSLGANGDLLVSGVLENTTDRERADWYIVVDVFDANGKTLNSIRMMNGKQIYTRRDFEILVKRGENVQELKEKARQPRGVVVPPKGKTAFEIRYLQPPDGIASFNAALQPFDPARLLREIEGETR